MAFLISFIIGLLVILLEEYLLGAHAGWSALNIYIIFIPIGAIVLGAFHGFILYLGMLRGRIPFGRVLISFAIILGILSYPSIRYMEYRTTYYTLAPNTNAINLNRSFQGKPIKDLGISFIDYEKQNLDYDNIVITAKRNNTLELPTNTFLNYTNYFIKWIGMALASLFMFIILAKDARYCLICKKFYREELLFNFLHVSYPLLFDELSQNVHNMEEYKNKYEADISNYRDYYQLNRSYCTKCKKGEIQIRHMVTKGNDIIEAEDNRKTFPF